MKAPQGIKVREFEPFNETRYHMLRAQKHLYIPNHNKDQINSLFKFIKRRQLNAVVLAPNWPNVLNFNSQKALKDATVEIIKFDKMEIHHNE